MPMNSLLEGHCGVDVRKLFFTKPIIKICNSLPVREDVFTGVKVFRNLLYKLDLTTYLTICLYVMPVRAR